MENCMVNKPASVPVTIYEYQWSALLGIVKISLHIEDRRPDLPEAIGKFKHYIQFKFFWKTVSIVTRSTTGIGTYRVDGKTVATSVQ